MDRQFQNPVLVNPTRPAAGSDLAFVDVDTFSRWVGRNTGNMAFLHALLMSIEGLKHITERPLATADIKVWGCSNFIAAHRHMMVSDEPLYTDGKPMVAVGLGAEAPDDTHDLKVPEPTQEWISAIASMAPTKSPNIAVRGTYTYRTLEKYGFHTKCTILGCPSLFISPYHDLGARIRDKVASPTRLIGVAPGNIGNIPKKTLTLERHLVELIDRHGGSYICQHPPLLYSLIMEPYSKLNLEELEAVRAAIQPRMALDDFLRWFRLHARLFDNIVSWLDHLRSLDLVLGTRFHGIQLALQAGTPALCIPLNARQVELCQTTRTPFIEREILGTDFSVEGIRAYLAAFDWDVFDRNRQDLARKFSQFLTANGLRPSKHLLSLWKDASPSSYNMSCQTTEINPRNLLPQQDMTKTPSNFIVTSFDKNFYNEGLNLVAGLHRTNYDTISRIIVYDLGLEEEQKEFLAKLEKVEIIQYPPIVHTFFPGYLHPYNYSFKCTALKDSCGYANHGDLILWMDAGLVPLKPIDEIFQIIDREGIFFVDHNDRPGWPFYNIEFTHPVSLAHLKATDKEKYSPHIRGALIGYKTKGKYQELIDQAFEFSKIKEIIEWPKQISENEEKSRRSIYRLNSPFAKTKVLLSKRFPQFKKTTRAKAMSYRGHRHDQSIYSILCARYGCKSYPGKKYCCGSKESSEISRKMWQSGGTLELAEANSKIPEDLDEALIYQHRGLYSNLDGLRVTDPETDQQGFAGRGYDVRASIPPSQDAAASTITVITPSFNQAEFLPECLASVAKQKHKPIEHLIYDPGSTDGSREIAREFSNKYAYAKLIEEPDRGQADAVSKGMLAARGDVIAWLNSDDIYADDNIFSQVIDRFNQDDKPDIVYGLAVFIDEKGNKLRDAYVNGDSSSLKARLHHEVGIIQPSTFFRSDVVGRLGTLNSSLHYAMDYEYWIRATEAGLRFAFVPVVLSCSRYYPGNKTVGQRENSFYETMSVVKTHYGYVHVNWLKRYASQLVEKHDGILQASDMSYDNPIIEVTVRQLATVYNTSADTVNLLQEKKDVVPYKGTHDEMRRLGFQLKRHCIIVPDGDKELWKEIREPDSIYHVRFVGGRRFALEKQWMNEEFKKVRERLPELKDDRQSDTCVIVGNGPSLMRTSLNLLEGQDVFVSNNAFIDRKLIGLAKYYAVTNYLVAEQGYWHINSLQHVHRFFPWFLGYCLNSDARTFFLNAVGDAEFRTDILEKISWKSTVSFFMMQIAYWLGYRKVVLIGFDHNYAQPDDLKEGDLIYQDQDDLNHFDPSYFKGNRWQAADVKNMEEVYWLAKRAFEGDGREIINATVGGRLEVFKRDSLENALSRRTYEQGAIMKGTPPPHGPSILAGCYARCDHAHFDESRLISAVLSDRSERPLMIDVGAMHGSALAPFLEHGWRVFAFEPDPVNRAELKERFGSHRKLIIDNRAVTHKAGEEMPFYRSDESSGISSLHPFRKSHKETCTVSTTTIADFVREKDLHHIDYLKIDVEGYDFQVLKGVPWDSIKPDVIMCEFEDSKTRALGYTMHDMAPYLTERGYSVLVSEWHPVIRYGVKHDWHRLVTYPCELNHPDAWGNLIAFREQPDLQEIATIARRIVKVDKVAWRGGMKVTSLRARGLYQRLVYYLKTHYPAIITIGRFVKWGLTTLKSTFFGIGGIAVLVTLGLYIAGALIEPARWYLVGIASALLLLGGALLALFYARFILNRLASDQRRQVSDINKALRASEATLAKLRKETKAIEKETKAIGKEVSVIKNDVFLIGYDILKEQNKLAEKVSQLETQAGNDRRAKRPPNDSSK